MGAAACRRRGSVLGTLIGAFIMGCLSNGSDLLGGSPYCSRHHRSGHYPAVTVDELRKRARIKVSFQLSARQQNRCRGN